MPRWSVPAVMVLLALLATLPAPGAAAAAPWRVSSFAYQLQKVDLTALGNSSFDLAVIDYSRDGTEAGRWSAEEIRSLQQGAGGPKRVLAYMSIGEAEEYRWYWDKRWRNPALRPDWLGPVNPQWPGNYKVKFWDPAWQALIYGSPDSYLDKIIAAGFDGVYLDIIEAYEFWAPDGPGRLNRASAEQEMVDFVKALATYAHETKGKPGFGVFVQNGEELATHPDYVAAVAGIGREDTWYNDNTPQPPDLTATVVSHLDTFRQAGKLVLVIDYVTRPELADRVYARASARGYVPYATVRGLDRLTIRPPQVLEFVIGESARWQGGERTDLDAAPIIAEGRTLLPLRYVAEPLSGTVAWDPAQQRVDLLWRGHRLSLWVGRPEAEVDGAPVLIDPENQQVTPVIVGGRTLVPLRFVAGALGARVAWDPDTRRVRLEFAG